jgi:microcystin-dependent protein
MKLNNQRFQNLVIDRNGSHQVQPNSGYGQSQNRQYKIQNHDNRLTTTNNNSNTTSTNQHTKIAKTASNTSTDSANSSNSVNSTNSINSITTGNNKDLSACPGF